MMNLVSYFSPIAKKSQSTQNKVHSNHSTNSNHCNKMYYVSASPALKPEHKTQVFVHFTMGSYRLNSWTRKFTCLIFNSHFDGRYIRIIQHGHIKIYSDYNYHYHNVIATMGGTSFKKCHQFYITKYTTYLSCI